MRPRDINIHRTRLDELTSTILKKSSYTLQKIEENLRLTHQLRPQAAFITTLDKRVEQLTAKLSQYQYVLTQLNSLLIRSEFFEEQLQMYESQQKVSQMRVLGGSTDEQAWKDDELNWKTSEATLENLWLEFRFLSRKVDAEVPIMSTPCSARSVPKQEDPQPVTPMRKQNEPGDEDIVLKPIRCVNKRDKSRRRSLNLNLLSYSPSIVSSPLLFTPDSSFNTSNIFTETLNQEIDAAILEKKPSKLIYTSLKAETEPLETVSPLSKRSKQTNSPRSKHKRANSEPRSVYSLTLTTDFSTPTQASLRHAVSLEAGLMIKKTQQSADEETVKDSEWINSPTEKFPELLKAKKFSCLGIYTPEATPDTSFVEEIKKTDTNNVNLQDLLNDSLRKVPEPLLHEEEAEKADELPTFEHRLNRSNSCDSIFSTMTSRIPLRPMKDSKAQTMSWMQKFSSVQRISAKPTNVTTLSVNNLSVSRDGLNTSRAVLSSLALQINRQDISGPVTSGFSFWFSSKKSAPTTSPSRTVTTSISKNHADRQVRSRAVRSSPVGIPNSTEVPSTEPIHIYETLIHDQQKQWSSNLLSRLNPQSFIPSKSFITSEVGKPMNAPANLSRTASTKDKRNLGGSVKGSFSTLTIGANGSTIVQHGESSMLVQSSVVVSKVSQDALKDALDSDFQFD
jgi:hypothetical protein